MLQKIAFQPGINKQVTETGAESQWVDCDNVRFRYGVPEKIGGWNQLGQLNSTALTDMQNDDAFKIALINHDHDYKNVDPGIAASNLGGMYFTAYSGTSTDPVIEYTLSGYGNNVIGVASADIAKVNGVATGDIEKIIGI